MTPILAGIVSAIPLSALGILYMLSGGKKLVKVVQNQPGEAAMTEQQWTYLFLATFALAPFVFGIAATIVYGLLNNVLYYQLVVLGLGVLLSVIAWVSKTPLPLEKTVMNLLVALVFGLLLPILAS